MLKKTGIQKALIFFLAKVHFYKSLYVQDDYGYLAFVYFISFSLLKRTDKDVAESL